MLTFHEFIAEGERRGYGRQEAAERLLQGIRKPTAKGRVLGLRKVLHLVIPTLEEERSRFQAEGRMNEVRRDIIAATNSIRRRELEVEFKRLALLAEPRERWETVQWDLEPSIVPPEMWTYFANVEADLTSQWQDDGDEPLEWANANWVAGSFQISEWCCEDRAARVNIEYDGLRITPNAANEILSYSDSELTNIIESWSGNDGTRFWNELKHDRKLGLHNQDQVRALWKALRNPAGKRGPRIVPAIS